MRNWKIAAVLVMVLLVTATAFAAADNVPVTMKLPVLGEKLFVKNTDSWKTVWLSDSKSAVKIGYVVKYENTEPVEVNWTGPAADGKAEGKGLLTITLKRMIQAKDWQEGHSRYSQPKQEIIYVTQGEAVMVGGMLNGPANLKTAGTNTNLSTGGKSSFSLAYEGHFKDGLEEGQGKSTANNKIMFEGQWKAGREDNGYLIWSMGAITYEGEIRDGIANGSGKATFRNLGSYQGEFKDGKYEGQAVFRYAMMRGGGDLARPDEASGGGMFQGAFSNDKPNGYGSYKNGRGEVLYEGEWKDGVMVK